MTTNERPQRTAVSTQVAATGVVLNNNERIKAVTGYEGHYAVTSNGRIWAYPNISRSKGRWLKQRIGHGGYPYVCLCKDGIVTTLKVHRLVAIAFIPMALDKPHVNHIDGIKTNNADVNL
jgi:hypothetical protein